MNRTDRESILSGCKHDGTLHFDLKERIDSIPSYSDKPKFMKGYGYEYVIPGAKKLFIAVDTNLSPARIKEARSFTKAHDGQGMPPEVSPLDAVYVLHDDLTCGLRCAGELDWAWLDRDGLGHNGNWVMRYRLIGEADGIDDKIEDRVEVKLPGHDEIKKSLSGLTIRGE